MEEGLTAFREAVEVALPLLERGLRPSLGDPATLTRDYENACVALQRDPDDDLMTRVVRVREHAG